MEEREFVAARDAAWKRLAAIEARADKLGLKALTRDEVRELGPLYRRTASDLAYARAHDSSPALVSRLNSLVAGGHGLLYRTDTRQWPGIGGFFQRDFPRAFRRRLPFFLASVGLTLMGFFAAYIVVLRDRNNIDIFIPPNSQFSESLKSWESGETARDIPDAAAAAGTTFYISNNTRVSFLVFAGGILFGTLSALVLFQNGALMGGLTGVITHAHQHHNYWPALVPHGVVELSAIFFSGAAGLSLGWALIAPGPYRRRDALILAARESVPLVLGTILMLIFAGFVEAFISHSALGKPLKIAFGITSGIALYSYLFLSGREKPTDDGRLTTDG
jgi:uncharacterized membrane protein SpoIIM required for sporulation